jgi:UDP-glucose 4-epimerase
VNEEPFTVFGKDYKTKDGTCVRDYVHVLDLAEAHGKAIEYLVNNKMSIAVNLGVGKGYSNLEIVQAVEKVTGKKMNIKYGERRPGDPDAIYADNAKAKKLLLWEPKYTDPASIIETAWRWHREHINGY